MLSSMSNKELKQVSVLQEAGNQMLNPVPGLLNTSYLRTSKQTFKTNINAQQMHQHRLHVTKTAIDRLNLKDTEILCADKGYDSEFPRAKINSTETQANIPRRNHSKNNNKPMDGYLYKISH